MKTLEQQVTERCKHFNGIMNDSCKAGVCYKDIRGTDKPFRFPCLDRESTLCSKAEFLSPEEVKKEIDEIVESSTKAVNSLIKIKSQNKNKGSVQCDCGGKITYSFAPTNQHVWAKCDTCSLSIME